MPDDTLITFGGPVKALPGNKVGGYLVRFSTAQDPDLVRDFFTPETDFDVDLPGGKASVYYNHGLDDTLKKRRLGKGELKVDDVGVWIEAQLEVRDRYEKAIYELAQAGKLGWSSGTASHLVERQAEGKSQRITLWPLGPDASLTPNPCEPRNSAIALKAWEQEAQSFKSVLTDALKTLSAEEEPAPAPSFAEYAAQVVSAVAALKTALADRKAARASEGREPSPADQEADAALKAEMDALFQQHYGITPLSPTETERAEPAPVTAPAPDPRAEALYRDFLEADRATTARLLQRTGVDDSASYAGNLPRP